jgi:signal peptidase I
LTFVGAGAVLLTALLLVVALPRALGRKPYRVPSGSMLPTLGLGSHFTANKHAYAGGKMPQVGDIVVFHPPQGSRDNVCGNRSLPQGAPCDRPHGGPARVTFVKRVVAVAGDRVALRAGRVIRNGRLAREPFANVSACGADAAAACSLPRAITVPPGDVYVLGDNRGASDDSRFWGAVPRASLIGRVDRCGFLEIACHARH